MSARHRLRDSEAGCHRRAPSRSHISLTDSAPQLNLSFIRWIQRGLTCLKPHRHQGCWTTDVLSAPRDPERRLTFKDVIFISNASLGFGGRESILHHLSVMKSLNRQKLRRISWLPSSRNHTVVNSKVIAVTVRPEPKVTESQLEIELAHNMNVSTSRHTLHVVRKGSGHPGCRPLSSTQTLA